MLQQNKKKKKVESEKYSALIFKAKNFTLKPGVTIHIGVFVMKKYKKKNKIKRE